MGLYRTYRGKISPASCNDAYPIRKAAASAFHVTVLKPKMADLIPPSDSAILFNALMLAKINLFGNFSCSRGFIRS
jgi:hypothetical protein